jgi:hypothetical protein
MKRRGLAMASKYFNVNKAEARELKKRSDEWDRRGWGIPFAVFEARWLAKLGRELRQMVRAYDGTAREAKKLLECILIAEEEGLPDVAEIRHELAAKLERKRAA